MIPLSVPHIEGNEWKYIKDCIDTSWVSSVGSYVDQFEKNFSEYIGTKHAIAVVNGTAALHISLLLAGVKPNDEVLVPNLTFVATANAVKYCFAKPVFIDVNWKSLTVDVEKLEHFLIQNYHIVNGKTINKITQLELKAILPMHTFGNPVDMDALNKICAEWNIHIIEDATESLGSDYKNQKTGNFGESACFSFNGNKIITTGGGGMITTNNESLAKRAKHLSTTAKSDPIEYYHDEIGYNYRLVNVLAAMGVAQLEKIDEYIDIKRKNKRIYTEKISKLEGFEILQSEEHSNENCWMYALKIDESLNISPSELVKQLSDFGIQARPIWKLMNTLPMYKDCLSDDTSTSESIYNSVINIPCSVNLTTDQIEQVVNSLESISESQLK